MPSNHLILCHPLLFLLSIFPSIRVFSKVSVLHIRWPKYWSFSFSISPSNEYSRLIFFRIDWFDLLAVQGTLESFIQHDSSKASILWCSAFFMVQLSYPFMTTGKTITLPTKAHLVKAMVFPVVMYGGESWIIKAEHWRIDAFELWRSRRLLRVPWTSRRSNQSILKKISLEYSLEGLMLKLQYFDHRMGRADSLEKTPMLGKIGGRRRGGNRGWDGWMASPTRWTWVWANSGSCWWTGKPGVLQSTGGAELK